MKDFEKLFSFKMTNGKYQLTLGIIGCLINLIDGSIFTILPFCIRFMQLDYGFTNYQASLLSSILLFGSVFTGPVTALSLDHFGRKTTIKFGALLGTSIGVMFYFCNTFFAMVLTMGIMGVYMVSVVSSLMLYLVETFTGPNKGKLIVGVYSFFSIGRLYGTLIARFTLSPYQYDYWKRPFFINSLILSLAFILILFRLKESVKYSFHKQKYSETVQNFNAIQKLNYSKFEIKKHRLLISENDLKQINALKAIRLAKELECSTVIDSDYEHILMTCVFSVSIVFSLYINFAQSMAVPNIMGTDTSTLTSNIIIISGELIGAAFMMTFIGHKSVGRKRIIQWSNFILIFVFLIPVIFQTVSLTIVMYLSKIFIKGSLSTSFIHLNESFPIHVRDKSVMATTTIVYVSTIFVPFFFFAALNNSVSSVFLMISSFALIAFLANIFLPCDLEAQNNQQDFFDKFADYKDEMMPIKRVIT